MMRNDPNLFNLIWALNFDLTFKLSGMDTVSRGDTNAIVDMDPRGDIDPKDESKPRGDADPRGDTERVNTEPRGSMMRNRETQTEF